MSSLNALIEDRAVLGTFLKLPRPEVVDILALAGLDFLICDHEHGQIDERDVQEVILAGRAAGIAIVVRVPDLDGGQVNRFLEAGAAGIQLSTVRTAGAARELRATTCYPPRGRRSLSTAQPAAGYGSMPLGEYLRSSDEETLRVGQLETATQDDPLEEILPPLDVAFVGVMDLSVSLGVPGQVESPAVRREVDRIARAARSTGTRLGIFAGSIAEARSAVSAGYRYVAVSSDLALLQAAARQAFSGLSMSMR